MIEDYQVRSGSNRVMSRERLGEWRSFLNQSMVDEWLNGDKDSDVMQWALEFRKERMKPQPPKKCKFCDIQLDRNIGIMANGDLACIQCLRSREAIKEIIN